MPPSTPAVGKIEPPQTAVTDVFTPTPQVLESTPAQTSVNDTAELFSSDRLGLCFSYPQGYTQLPYNDTVEIVAPDLPGTDTKGLFWLEISDSYNRTAEKIADQDMTYAVAQQGAPSKPWSLDRDARWRTGGGAGWYAGSGPSAQGVRRAPADSLHPRVHANSLGE